MKLKASDEKLLMAALSGNMLEWDEAIAQGANIFACNTANQDSLTFAVKRSEYGKEIFRHVFDEMVVVDPDLDFLKKFSFAQPKLAMIFLTSPELTLEIFAHHLHKVKGIVDFYRQETEDSSEDDLNYSSKDEPWLNHMSKGMAALRSDFFNILLDTNVFTKEELASPCFLVEYLKPECIDKLNKMMSRGLDLKVKDTSGTPLWASIKDRVVFDWWTGQKNAVLVDEETQNNFLHYAFKKASFNSNAALYFLMELWKDFPEWKNVMNDQGRTPLICGLEKFEGYDENSSMVSLPDSNQKFQEMIIQDKSLEWNAGKPSLNDWAASAQGSLYSPLWTILLNFYRDKSLEESLQKSIVHEGKSTPPLNPSRF